MDKGIIEKKYSMLVLYALFERHRSGVYKPKGLSKTRLQKIFFDVQNKIDKEFFEFEQKEFSPFSRQLCEEADYLAMEKGPNLADMWSTKMFDMNGEEYFAKQWSINNNGLSIFEDKTNAEILSLVCKYEKLDRESAKTAMSVIKKMVA